MQNLDLSYSPAFSITIGGRPQKELERSVINISIDESIEKASMFTINLKEEPDPETRTFDWLDNGILDPGSDQKVEIYLGYANSPERAKEPAIAGVITDLEPDFPSRGNPSLKVSGYDHSFRLQMSASRDVKTFDNEGDCSDIVKKIAKKHNLGEGEIEPAFKPPETTALDDEASDYQFLDGLAKSVGYEFFVRGKKLYFRKPRDQARESRSLKWGLEIISFRPNLNAAKAIGKVTVRGHNPSDPSEPIVGVATSLDQNFKEAKARGAAEFVKSKRELEITSRSVSNAEEAKAMAKGWLVRSNNSLIEGTCECLGIPEIRAGTNIMIEGVGKRFSGKYYLKSARHSIGEGGYTLTLTVRRGGVGNV